MWKKWLHKDKDPDSPATEPAAEAPARDVSNESAPESAAAVSTEADAPTPSDVAGAESAPVLSGEAVEAEAVEETEGEEDDGRIVTVRETGPCRREISVEVVPERMQREMDDVVKVFRGKARIPGFRPGKAPLHMVRAKYAAEILEEAKERVASSTLDEELERRGFVPLQRPRITKFEYEDGGSLTYTADVEVAPQIPTLEIESLKGKRPRVEVLDPEIEEELNRLRDSQAEVVAVERPSQTGDILRISYRMPARKEESASGLVTPSGDPIPSSGAAADSDADVTEMPVELGAGALLPELEQGLTGVLAGGERDVQVKYPEDYRNQQLAGREVSLHVTVKEVNEKRLPALDDAFAARVLEGSTLAQLRERISEAIRRSKDREAERRFTESLFDALLERAPFEVPESMVVSMERQLHADLEQRVGPEAPELRDARLRQMYRSIAEREVRRMFVLREIARQQGLRVTRDEVEARLQAMTEELASMEGMGKARARKAVRADGAEQRTAERLLEEKVVQLLRQRAEVEEGSPV